jgi:hypothetical protein
VLRFGCVLVANWGVAVWLIDATHKDREITVLQLVNQEARSAEKTISDLFENADRTIRDARARFREGSLDLAPDVGRRHGTSRSAPASARRKRDDSRPLGRTSRMAQSMTRLRKARDARHRRTGSIPERALAW